MAIQDIQNSLNNLTSRIQSEGITDNNGNQILSPTLAADALNNAYKTIGLPPPPVPANVPPITPVSNTGNSTMSDLFKTYLGESTPPPSMESQYNKDYTNIGIDEKQQKVNDLTAQINDIAAQQQAQELQMKNEGISAGAIQGRNLDLERQNAIRVLPLKAQLDAAQGNLTAAQDKLNTLFKIQSQDAQNQYEYKQKLIDSVYQFATKEQQAQLDAKSEDLKWQHQLELENIKQENAVALKNMELSGNGSIDPSNIIAYAQQYASTGQIPTGLPKGTFGSVAQIAKDLPKVNGEIVDNNTGIKSNKLTFTQSDGFAALKDLTNKIDQAKELFDKIHTGFLSGLWGSVFPSEERQQYNTLKSEIVDLLARARSGAALTADEVTTYSKKLPNNFNKQFWIGQSGDTLLTGLKSSIEGKLDTGLKSQGVSMYGFSKVKLSDGKDYLVGQIIDVNGSKGRVNPDGTITPIQ